MIEEMKDVIRWVDGVTSTSISSSLLGGVCTASASWTSEEMVANSIPWIGTFCSWGLFKQKKNLKWERLFLRQVLLIVSPIRMSMIRRHANPKKACLKGASHRISRAHTSLSSLRVVLLIWDDRNFAPLEYTCICVPFHLATTAQLRAGELAENDVAPRSDKRQLPWKETH